MAKRGSTQPVGFEPTLPEGIWFRVRRLNHSATTAWWRRRVALPTVHDGPSEVSVTRCNTWLKSRDLRLRYFKYRSSQTGLPEWRFFVFVNSLPNTVLHHVRLQLIISGKGESWPYNGHLVAARVARRPTFAESKRLWLLILVLVVSFLSLSGA